MKTLIVGNGGRESSIAMKLAEDSCVYAVLKHENPTILGYVKKTGGRYLIGDTNNAELISNFAKEQNIDLAFVSADDPLEAGVVDGLLDAGIRSVGPTREGAEIEWNKQFANELMKEILPEFTARFWVAGDLHSLNDVFNQIKKENLEIVVKPQGLTGGKGVKVMGEHLKNLEEAKKYAAEVLANRIGKSESVIMAEKLQGIEFTMMALTDGKTAVPLPATYDYPYRFDGEKGPGTGGMGSLSDKVLHLPFMTQKNYEKSTHILERALKALREQGREFSGVLYAGLFLTNQGLKFIEFNARFGDPECMNTLSVLDSSLADALEKICDKRIKPSDVKFKNKASVVKYLVAPEYCLSPGKPHQFEMDVQAIKSEGFQVFFSSAVEANQANHFKTVGTSRNVAIAAVADSIPEAASKIDDCIERRVRGPLQYRKDIGSLNELQRLKDRAVALRG